MQNRWHLFLLLASLPAALWVAQGGSVANTVSVHSPGGAVQCQIVVEEARLRYAMTFRKAPVLEPAALRLIIDGVDLAEGVELGKAEAYEINETYPWHGVHAQAKNHCTGVRIRIRNEKSRTSFTLEVRVFNDGAAYRWLVPGDAKSRVPDEASTFLLPAGSTAWHHDLEGHYEDVHAKTDVAAIKAGVWVAPPLTFKLPNGAGYAAITEADLRNYSGMALQADGSRGFTVRLGHSHPPCYPFRLRYSADDVKRLAEPAAIAGAITTPWRVVMVGPDLNTLVNADIVPNLCPPPDKRLFPQGLHADWIKPGRAVWRYLDGGGDNSLGTMKEFCRLAGELGFEHHIIEGFWARWSDAEIKDLVSFARQHRVGIWLWKHSKTLREPEARHAFLKRCHDLGITGVKIDFFDHEAKEMIDLYQVLLKETAEHQLLVNFHGANKPTGESRTWPNELTREAIRGMEASKLADRATHNVTLPFTRLLAGHAEYTPVLFGERRRNTTWAHQVASAAILSAPLLTYGATPANLLANPCFEIIKSIPSIWDETLVLPPSAIGETAVFARRKGDVWFLAILNGTTARSLQLPLSFLAEGSYRAFLVHDDKAEPAAVRIEKTSLKRSAVLTVDLREGGGFIGRFVRE